MAHVSEATHLANMDFGHGNTKSWLEIVMNETNIFFCRNDDGVHAWHCGYLPITDRRILEIKAIGA